MEESFTPTFNLVVDEDTDEPRGTIGKPENLKLITQTPLYGANNIETHFTQLRRFMRIDCEII